MMNLAIFTKVGTKLIWPIAPIISVRFLVASEDKDEASVASMASVAFDYSFLTSQTLVPSSMTLWYKSWCYFIWPIWVKHHQASRLLRCLSRPSEEGNCFAQQFACINKYALWIHRTSAVLEAHKHKVLLMLQIAFHLATPDYKSSYEPHYPNITEGFSMQFWKYGERDGNGDRVLN